MKEKPKKKVLTCILDSHVGELYNLVPMLHFWANNGELKNHHLRFINIGHSMSRKDILNEIKLLKNYCSFNVECIKIVSPSISLIVKLFNFLHFLFKIFLKNNSYLFIVPYDQKNIFYFFISFINSKVIAVPHTTGSETYSKGFYKNKILRRKKNIPVLTKNNESEDYYKAFGFRNQIVAGNYSLNEDYIKLIINSESSELSNSLCVFSLGKKSKMFSEDSWVNTHLDIFRSAIYAGYNQIFLKMHPSQPHSDFEFLKSISNRMGLDLILVNGHPTVVSKKFNNFITILTSAGQHAIHENKSVCCYAVKKMRFEVKKFGNDPFPYQNLDADEILDIRDLKQWLLKFKNVKPIQKENIKKNRLLRLEEIILEIE